MRAAHRLESLSIKNYKAFEGTIRLDLRPLTIVFGRNAAGKSVATRLPVLFTEALGRPGTPGFPLEAAGVRIGTSFLDLLHGRLLGLLEAQVVLETDGDQIELNVTIGPDAGTSSRQPIQRIHAWSMRSRASGTLVELRWLREGEHAYELGAPGQLVRGDVEFDGIVPVRAVGDPRTHLVSTGLPVLDAAPRSPLVAHLGPFREPLRAYYPMPGMPTTTVGARGEHAAGVLGSRGAHGKTFERVSQWFQQHLNLDLQISEVGAEDSELGIVLKVRPIGRSTWTNISNAGTGTMHVLPYVVQHAIASDPEAHDTSPDIIACEEPEAHLHPAAQAGLADLAVETALAGRARVIVETHSENLLLRVRRHVAEKRLSPEQVGIYWVDDEGGQTTLTRLDIEPDGWVVDWPDGIFAEATSEARAIGRANRDQQEPRSGDESRVQR